MNSAKKWKPNGRIWVVCALFFFSALLPRLHPVKLSFTIPSLLALTSGQLGLDVFLILRLTGVLVASLFGLRRVPPQEQANTIRVVWDGSRYTIHLVEGIHLLTVKDLKNKLKKLTGVPVSSMRLTVSNAHIKDDTATLVSVGIHPYCIVELQGEQVNEEQVAASTQSGNPEEYALIRRMDVILSGMDDLLVVIDEYEAMVQAAAPPLDEDAKKKIHDKGVYCSEGLMQALIRLDSVECPMGFETARQQRRQGVRHVQKHLDRVDGMRTKAKALTQ